MQTCKLIEQRVFQKKKDSMNSIHQQQPENNQEDLRGKEAIEKMREIIDKAKTCFFCTSSASGTPMAVRPMSVQQLDEEGNLWFLSANDSHTNSEIATDNTVQLLFQASAHSGFLTIDGKATISTDKQKIKELWESVIKTWFTGGVDDPRITVIKVVPQTGYYWDNKHGNMVAGIKMLIGAATGKTLDDSIEGKIMK